MTPMRTHVLALCLLTLCTMSFAQNNGTTAYRKTLTKIYDTLSLSIEDRKALVAAKKPLPGTFATDVVGRIRPFGLFQGIEEVLGAFYIAVPTTTSPVSDFTVQKFVAAKPYASLRVRGKSSITGLGNSFFTQEGKWRFNDNGLVTGFDIKLVDLESALSQTQGGLPLGESGYWAKVITASRACSKSGCIGPNKQYGGRFGACRDALLQLPFQGVREGNNALCRALFSELIEFRPDEYCKYLGPGGGGRCVDKANAQRRDSEDKVLGLPWVSGAVLCNS